MGVAAESIVEATGKSDSELNSATARLNRRLRRRIAPLIATSIFLIVAMNFSLLWHGLTAHSFSTWLTPPDLWGTYLGSDFLVQGHPSQIYSSVTGLNAFPAIVYLFTPITAVGHALHLEVGQPFRIFTAPTAWIIVGPLELMMCCMPLFAADATAERFDADRTSRLLIALFGAAVLGPIAVRWGHPEDCIAVALFMYAALDTTTGRWRRSAWLLGLAVAFQPLVIVGLGAILAPLTVRQLARSIPALVLPSLALLAAPLIASWHATTQALFNQPNFPTLNHPTPWTPLFHHSMVEGVTAVASGPMRVVTVLIAVTLGAIVCRNDSRLVTLLFVFECTLILRVLLEPVVDPYYIWPALAVGIVLTSRLSWTRIAANGVVAIVATWWSGLHLHGTLLWWCVLMLLLLVVLWLSSPGPLRRQSGHDPDVALATNE